MGLTEFTKKHTRHITPVFIGALAFIAVPVLVTLDEGFENLSKATDPRPYDYKKPWIKAAIVMFTALGAWNSQALQDRRKKIIEEDTKHLQRPLTEEEFHKLQFEKGQTSQTK